MEIYLKDVQDKALEKVTNHFPNFPVSIDESTYDDMMLCVRVFAVPSARVVEVKEFIRQTGRDLMPDGSCMLLPLVKDMAITRKYYPEYLPNAFEVNESRLKSAESTIGG